MLDWVLDKAAGMRLDGWEALGLAGEGLFFARMAAQWTASERAKKPVLPMVYWYLSLAGALLVAVYALHKQSLAFLLPQLVGCVFYARGWQLERRHRSREAWRRKAGFDRPDYPWPSLSIIVPVKNEEKILPERLPGWLDRAREYPGPPPEIVVAANGCADGSIGAAKQGLAGYADARVVESDSSGMSLGKNLGAAAASRSGRRIWVFLDADTELPPNALRMLAERLHGMHLPMATVAGRPEKGGLVVRACFAIANRLTRRRRTHAPGGVMAMTPEVFDLAGGFDESLPQGTSTAFMVKALASGAVFAHIDAFRAVTSIRRFEKTGIVRQMLAWRKNHRYIFKGQLDSIRNRPYDDAR